MADVRNTDDVIYSRDVIARIEELEDERQTLVDELDNAKETRADAEDPTSVLAEDTDELTELENAVNLAEDAITDWDADNADELKALKDLAEEGESSPDWEYGETLIRDSYFTEHVQELLADAGDLPRDLPWCIVIDWEETANNLRADYFSVDFDGVEYWIRA